MRVLKCITIVILLVFSISACSQRTADPQQEKPHADPVPTKTKPKKTTSEKSDYTVERAVKDGHIVKEQLTDDMDDFYKNKADSAKLYNLKKIFAFEQNVDNHGHSEELKITLFLKGHNPLTSTLSYDGKLVHYKTANGSSYECESINTGFTAGNTNLVKCTQNGKKLDTIISVLSDNQQHFEELRKEFLDKDGSK